jgi:hypothetical protein
MKERVIIGIDPDVEASGLGIVRVMQDGKIVINYCHHPLPRLVATIKWLHDKYSPGIPVDVYVEAGWLNKGNWHLNPRDNRQLAAAKGRQAGRNHQLGLDICSLLDECSIRHIEIAPLTKCWKGKDRKITHEELHSIIRNADADGMPRQRSNQEERDALLIAWVFAGLPIRY